MKKRILSALLICSIMLCMIVPVSAATSYTSGLYTYTVTDGKATITKVDTSIYGLKGKVTIPSTMGGYPVVAIGKEAYKNCKKMVNVIIPEGVTSIGENAFYACEGMVNVIIPEGVTSIGECAFCGCDNLTSITIPEGVTSIGECTFLGCGKLKEITIPSSVTTIGERAFEDCYSLESVYIYNIKSWININFDSYYDKLAQDDYSSNPLKYAENLYLNGGLVTDLVIPDVSGIKSSVFYGCESLTSVTIPEGVTWIGKSAFRACTNLTSITIPKSVTSIGVSAFNCKLLQTVNYTGTEEDWCIIRIGDDNDYLHNADIILNYNAGVATAEITDAEASGNKLKFISETKIEGEPEIATFGTTFIPLWLFETGSSDIATVEYDNAEHNIQNAQTFGATVTGIPESCKDMQIVGKSFIKDADGNYTWSAAKSASVNDTELVELK